MVRLGIDEIFTTISVYCRQPIYKARPQIRLLGKQIQGLDSRLDNECYGCHYRFVKQSRQKPPTSIRINRDILHQAHVAAVTERKTLGQWLEEAIIEEDCRRVKRESGG